MSEPRRPDAVLSVRAGDIRHKFEMYRAAQFQNADMLEQPQTDSKGVPTVRLRHNGVWLPPGHRQLMTVRAAVELAESVIEKQLKGI